MLTTFQESRWLGKSSRWEYQCHRQGPLPPLLGNLLAKITTIEKSKLPVSHNYKQGVDDSLHLLRCVRRHSWGSRWRATRSPRQSLRRWCTSASWWPPWRSCTTEESLGHYRDGDHDGEHGDIVSLTLPVAEEPWWTTQGNSSQPSKVILSIEALEPVGCFETVLQDYNEDQWTRGKLTTVLDWNVPSIYHRDQRKGGKETKHFLKNHNVSPLQIKSAGKLTISWSKKLKTDKTDSKCSA